MGPLRLVDISTTTEKPTEKSRLDFPSEHDHPEVEAGGYSTCKTHSQCAASLTASRRLAALCLSRVLPP